MSNDELFKELDEKQEQSIAEANAVLRELDGHGGRWWGYMVSHRTFDFFVGDCFGRNNIAFCATGCTFIQGPMNWANQQLHIHWHNDRGGDGWSYTLVDESSGFRVECKSLMWRRNFDILSKKSLYRSA